MPQREHVDKTDWSYHRTASDIHHTNKMPAKSIMGFRQRQRNRLKTQGGIFEIRRAENSEEKCVLAANLVNKICNEINHGR